MASFDWLSQHNFWPQKINWSRQELAVAGTSPLNNQTQINSTPGDQWLVTMQFPQATTDDRLPLDTYLQRVGKANTIALWDLRREIPKGTMRGSPTLASAAAFGDSVLLIQTTAGWTLVVGDMIGVGNQLFMVVENAVANGSGVMAVNVICMVRANSIASGSAVTWYRPTANFRITNGPIAVTYMPGRGADAFAIELLETF